MFSGSQSIAHFTPRNISIWLSMAFQGGVINAGGLLACHRFVSHTTGFATIFGSEAAQGHFNKAFGVLSVPLFFLVGAVISAFFIDRNLALRKTPRYEWMFGFIVVAMISVSLIGHAGEFGPFGSPSSLSSDYILLSLLCLCSGIQNATITSASGAVIRTTHLTGITTDLGIGLVRTMSSGRNQDLRENEKRANWMRLGLILSFAAGSTVSAFMFYRFDYLGFLGPALISTWLVILVIRNRHLSQRHGEPHARAS